MAAFGHAAAACSAFKTNKTARLSSNVTKQVGKLARERGFSTKTMPACVRTRRPGANHGLRQIRYANVARERGGCEQKRSEDDKRLDTCKTAGANGLEPFYDNFLCRFFFGNGKLDSN